MKHFRIKTIVSKAFLLLLCFIGYPTLQADATDSCRSCYDRYRSLLSEGLEGTIAYEHEMNYHNAMEYFASYYIKYDKDPEAGYVTKNSFWKSYNMWTVGVAYKPCVVRGKNYHGNLRIGVSGGSDLHQAVGVGTLGYEHTFNLYNGWSVFFKLKKMYR